MFEIKEISYEEARSEYFKERMQRAQRNMKYWESRIDRSRPNNLVDIARLNASDAGRKYNFYKDALEALENNKFQYETGFVKGFEAAQPKWISVEERLPDKPGEVLICLFGNACVAYYHKNRYFKTRRGVVWWSKNDVTHWMPLPEPPKEE